MILLTSVIFNKYITKLNTMRPKSEDLTTFKIN